MTIAVDLGCKATKQTNKTIGKKIYNNTVIKDPVLLAKLHVDPS